MPGPGTVVLVDPEGRPHELPTDQAGAVLDQPGWHIQTEDDRLGRLSSQAKEVDYGGAGGAVKAGAAGVLRGASLGLSDVAARAVGGDDAAFDLSALREVNPTVSTVSEIAGAVAPAVISGGASTPAGAASRLGARITALGEGAGTIGRVTAATAGGAVEGGIYGLGAGVSELALSDEPLTLERAASTLSSNALFGVGTGGLVGGAGKLAEIGLSRAKGAIDSALERQVQAQKVASGSIDPATVDVALLDRAGLREARAAELKTIEQQQAPLREVWVDGLQGERELALKKQIWRATEGAEDRATRSIGKAYVEADIKIDRLLKDRVTLAEHPERALSPLRQQQQALEALDAMRIAESDAFETGIANAPAMIRQEILNNKVPGYIVGKGGLRADSPLIDQAVEREIGRRYGNLSSPTRPKRLQYLDQVPDAIEANRTLQEGLAGLTRAPMSDRLAAIAAAEDALATPAGKSLGEHIIGAIPFAGPLGAIASASKKAIGGLRGAAGKAATRAGQAASSFLDVANKAAVKATPLGPVVATKVLAAVSYAPPTKGAAPSTSKPTLPALYKARTDEIKSQVHIAPDGSFQMRPDARARVAERLRAVGASDPRAADRIESLAARRIEWLASQIPRRPDLMGMQAGPDRWQPSDMEMRSFARKVAAAEDPGGVLERLAHGAISPEDAETMAAVHPELKDDFTQQIMQRLPELQKSLPYSRRLALSIFTGIPVDPSMDPKIISAFQAQFEYQPEPPRASPQFGSVKSSEIEPGTASQRREQGAL